LQSVEEAIEAVDCGGDPLHHGSFVEEEFVVDFVFHLEEGFFDGGDACEAVDVVG